MNPLFSIITATITTLYVSYSIPIICLLLRGRNSITRGPFWCGTLGLVSNIILLLWTAFTLVAYSLPPYRPVTPTSKYLRLQDRTNIRQLIIKC